MTDRMGHEIHVRAGQLDLQLFRQHVNQARTAARHGRHDEAAAEYRVALGDIACICIVRNELGETLRESGELFAAIGEHRAALAAAMRVGLKLEHARALDGIAMCLRSTEPEAARQHWRRALAPYREMGVPEQADVERHLAMSPVASMPGQSR